MDEAWGLSWSQRWHLIDEERSRKVRAHTLQAVSRCGIYVYRQAQVLRANRPSHLWRVVNGDVQAPPCKHCERSGEHD